MNKLIERYNKFYKKKEVSDVKVFTERADDDHSPVYSGPENEKLAEIKKKEVENTPEVKKEDKPDVYRLIKQLIDQENSIRNQREKYRMNYYKLEAQKAHREEFLDNYRIIQSLTEQLAPIYIKRRKLETTGEIEEVKQLSSDEENEIRALKYKKKRLVDKKSKLQSKISNYLAFANGPKNLPKWEAEMDLVNLNIYEIDEAVQKIEEK